MFSYITTGMGADFGALISGGLSLGVWQPVLWNLLFMVLTWAVCVFGASGIEKASKFMMPALFVLLIIVIIRSVTLPGSGAGLAFIFANTSGFSLAAIPAACGQVFFSLSLGMGAMITYGSYLSKSEVLPKSSIIIASMDTSVAVLASIAIFPAVFAMGGEPGAGAGLAFITLPGVFDQMPLGAAVGAAFFLLIFFAAITSSISLVEACSAFMADSWGWNKRKAVHVLCLIMTALSIPNAMSMAEGNIFSGTNVLGTGMNLFDTVDFFANNILLPVGGLLMCYIIGWKWKPENAIAEIESTPNYKFKLAVAWKRCIQFVTPILLVIVLIVQVQQIIAMYSA
jgi:NSS family neurotransmitter:Na+ symporter